MEGIESGTALTGPHPALRSGHPARAETRPVPLLRRPQDVPNPGARLWRAPGPRPSDSPRLHHGGGPCDFGKEGCSGGGGGNRTPVPRWFPVSFYVRSSFSGSRRLRLQRTGFGSDQPDEISSFPRPARGSDQPAALRPPAPTGKEPADVAAITPRKRSACWHLKVVQGFTRPPGTSARDSRQMTSGQIRSFSPFPAGNIDTIGNYDASPVLLRAFSTTPADRASPSPGRPPARPSPGLV